jgi:hypothetical protein
MTDHLEAEVPLTKERDAGESSGVHRHAAQMNSAPGWGERRRAWRGGAQDFDHPYEIADRSPSPGWENLCPHTRYATCLASEGMQATLTNSEALLSADRLEASA